MIGSQPFDKTVARVNENHALLASMWPRVKALAPRLSGADKAAWSELVYVQQGIEIQLVSQLRERYGKNVQVQSVGTDLGMFAGYPGTGGASVPRLVLEAPPILPIAAPMAPLAIGKWALTIAGSLLVLLGVLKVTGALDLLERHWTATAKYDQYLDALEKRGFVPPPPPEPRAGGVWLAAGALALLGGGAWLFSRRRAA